MHEVYNDVYAIALEKIAEFGMDVVVTSGAFVYDPVAGSRSGATTDKTYKALKITDFSRLISDFRIIGNSSTMKVDVCFMFGGDIVLEDDDTISAGGLKYSIIQVKRTAPAGVNIIQYALCRV